MYGHEKSCLSFSEKTAYPVRRYVISRGRLQTVSPHFPRFVVSKLIPFQVDEPNRVWASDVTCFKINHKYLYVCAILDLFSRKVIAHKVSPKNSTYLITTTFKQAFQSRNAPQSLMFHSDQGAQYTSKTFRKLLRMNKVVQSFSKAGQPHDNAVMESFFASMKREEIYRTQYKSEQQFTKIVNSYAEFYNTQRPHSTLNCKTSDQFETIHEAKKRAPANLDIGVRK